MVGRSVGAACDLRRVTGGSAVDTLADYPAQQGENGLRVRFQICILDADDCDPLLGDQPVTVGIGFSAFVVDGAVELNNQVASAQ